MAMMAAYTIITTASPNLKLCALGRINKLFFAVAMASADAGGVAYNLKWKMSSEASSYMLFWRSLS